MSALTRYCICPSLGLELPSLQHYEKYNPLDKPSVYGNLLLKPKLTKTMMQVLLQESHQTPHSHLSPEEKKLLSLGERQHASSTTEHPYIQAHSDWWKGTRKLPLLLGRCQNSSWTQTIRDITGEETGSRRKLYP